MDLDDFTSFKKLDPQNMLGEMENLPRQLQAAWELGQTLPLPAWQGLTRILISGMGGSAIGADLLAAYIASACSIPVVNYDVYRLGYADFKNVPGVLETKNKIEFRSLVARLVSDSSFYNKVAGQQKAVMSRWGKLDGNSTERVLSLCDQLIRSKRGLS